MIPDAPILEFGCGTGFLTERLVEHFPDREIIVSDTSRKTIQFCKQKLQEKALNLDNVTFKVLDVDNLSESNAQYGLVIGNFVPHWFKDTSLSLQKLSELIVPGGLLLTSFPGNHSLETWYEHCLTLGVPHTAHPLPDVEEVVVKLSTGPMQIDYYENDLFEEFNSTQDFFRHLKKTGAGYSQKKSQLSYKQFKLLTNYWDKKASGKVEVKWHIVYLAAKKDL